MATTSYVIEATPKVLERVYYAIERCKRKPEASAQSLNREIATKFGAPISTSIWTTINAARRDNALSRIKTRAFDFTKHGRTARTGKSGRTKKVTATSGKGRRSSANIHRFPVDSKKHPRYVIATWEKGKRSYNKCKTRKEVDRTVRRFLRKGVALSNMAIYRTEPIEIKLSVKP